ncbi:PAS domain S-box protein [Sphingomonas sp. M1-B02]|uniref:PAS domain S-box protein n=1 Tax=Sphingomonas sp. M1-B02 TaxID=3114300 RepID=UPI00223E9678|nr:PAS domain S-box protein [Sphingomonas sp. S6-11]UZK66679.1 PAS domain S-box protein [Sphingomonas sp. S6-11]
MLLGAAISGLLCFELDVFELLVAFAERHEAWLIDEAITVLLIFGTGSLILFARRSTELRREALLRHAAEQATAELTRQILADGVAERRFLEEAVRANEQRLQSILATAHQAIVTIDRDGTISGWNRHAELTFGWNADEVIGQRMSEIIVPPELRAGHDAGLARFMASRSARLIGSRIELTAIRRNGDVFPIELALSATNIGEDWQFTALIQDISERLAKIELFENAFDHAPTGMALVALDGRLMKVNSAFCDLIGFEREAALTLDFQTITHPDDLAGDELLLRRLIAGEIPSYQLEKRYIRKSGRVVWVRLSVSLVLGNDGTPKHLIAQVQDLSAERESEDRYRLLAESASDMVGLYSIEGRCLYMSPSSEKILGYAPDAVVGKSVFEFMPPEERDPMRRATVRLIAAPPGSTVRHLTRLRHGNGDLIHIEFAARVVASEDGTPQIVSACRDVTIRMEAQRALQERSEELVRAHAAAERSAAAVREAEVLFKGIFDSSSDINIVYAVDGNSFSLITMNEVAERSLGIPVAAGRGKGLGDLFPPERAKRMQRDLEAAIVSGEGQHTIEQGTHAGHDAIFDIRLVPLRNDLGAVHRVFVSKRDISELKRAEREALKANVLMQAAEKIGHMGYSSLDLITQEMTWSDEIWTIFDLDREHDTPSFDKLIARRHPEDREHAAEALANALASGATDYQNSYRLLLPNGEIRHILARGTIQRDAGVAVSAFGVLLDISELKRAEQQARESDQRYRLMAENSTDVIVTSDLAGRTTFVSPSSVTVIGYGSEERMGEQAATIAHPEDLPGLRAAFRALRNGEAGKCVRWRAWHKIEERWVWLESSPALMRDGETQAVTGYLDVIRDVTAQKEQEDALAAAKLAAEDAMHSKEHFLANMSHELRTPLNSIIGFSRLLNESIGLAPEVQRRVRMVQSAGIALHGVIDNVLDYSKLEADKLSLHCNPFDVDVFFTTVVSLLEPQAALRDVSLRVEIDPALPTRLVGDSGRLRQILLNLLSNAVKFTCDGTVTTRVRLLDRVESDARMRIEIVDTGSGIAQDKLANLFNRFVQANASVARHYGGTGLGLAISRQLVTLMGGEIGVASELGAGSTFWFEVTLPIADVQECNEHEVSGTESLSLEGKRVLVVDDVDLNRELMTAILSKYGCAVELAEDGVGAIAALKAQRFDLILMDCHMPVMDGFEATRTIRAQAGRAATVPIVALTASAQPEHLARCLQAGMNDHLTKPLEPHALDLVLRRYLAATPAGGDVLHAAAVALDSDHPPQAAPVAGSLRARYEARRREMLQALGEMIRSGRFTDEEVSVVNVMAHNLAGTAAMFGEAELGDAAAALDQGLAQWAPDERRGRTRESYETMRRITSISAQRGGG